jgi:hypothetical protein
MMCTKSGESHDPQQHRTRLFGASSLEQWTSPPVFDHGLLDRLVQAGYVTTPSAALDAICYEITDSGRVAAIATGF